MAKAEKEAPVAAEATKEVRLLKNYVPMDGATRKAAYPGNDPNEVVYDKIPAGEVIALPLDEARRAVKLGIATIDADLF